MTIHDRLALGFAIALCAALDANAAEYVRLAAMECSTPAYLHCPEANCPSDRVINPGPAVEMQTRRTYFLDYPCDLKADEEVTLVLSLHGAGSYGNWQRHYFPLLDLKESHRLVIATPNSPTRTWSEADDGYLRNIVEGLVTELGPARIRAFWIVGHSQGGMTANRLVRSEYFQERVDGWMSLSGGRLGGNAELAAGFGPPRPPNVPEPTPEVIAELQARFAAMRALLMELPEAPFSFIFTTGEREIAEAGVPAASAWAEKLGCGARAAAAVDVVDTRGGYIYDSGRQNPPSPSWGLLPGGGTARVASFPDCRDGRVVADVVRLGKGHTEGLEPNVTRALADLMLEAKGGRIRALKN